MLARKATLLPKFVEQTLPWTQMLSYMFDNLKTKPFGSWDTNGKLDGHIIRYLFSSKLLKH